MEKKYDWVEKWYKDMPLYIPHISVIIGILI